MFPELSPTEIKFSYTNGFACAMTCKATKSKFNIGYNTNKPLYYAVLGHELMHFAQEFTKIPSGEAACDVYTLARSNLFTDYPPSYIDLPPKVIENWSNYAHDVQKLCVESLEVRKHNKMYIKWLKKEIGKLV